MNAVKDLSKECRKNDVFKVFNFKFFEQNKIWNKKNKSKCSFSCGKNYICIRKKLFNVFFSVEDNTKNNKSFISNKLFIKSLSEKKILMSNNCSKNSKYLYIKDFIKTGKIKNEILKIKQKFINNINKFHEI